VPEPEPEARHQARTLIWQAVGGLDKRAAAANAQVAANAFAAAGLPNTRGGDGNSGGESLAVVLADGVRAGLLNRQEAVSMLPVLALRVPAGASCLDSP
jgi:16S rRNA C967 or C1407 C5-methylase (RsmB/RsmF family)